MKYILGFQARPSGVSNVSIRQPYGRRGEGEGGSSSAGPQVRSSLAGAN